mgnify:FL=1
MDYQQAVDYIESPALPRGRYGLERLKQALELLGNPQHKVRFVHVAGTNGKGSCAAMLASVLKEAGYRTGLYISPHLRRYNERMQVDGVDISDDDLIRAAQRVKEVCEQLGGTPIVFEVLTLMALWYFAERRCDFVVLEVGIGGKLDATNCIPAPAAALIAQLGFDHTETLGSTIEEIAAQKGGIAKPGSQLVMAEQEPAALRVVEQLCREQGCGFTVADPERLQVLSTSLEGQRLRDRTYGELLLPLAGSHQVKNAANVLTVVEVLKGEGFAIPDRAVRQGIESTVWPARFERLSRSPDFILDGGHNPQCVQAAVQALQDYYPGKKVVFLTGMMKDKDSAAMLAKMAEVAKAFVCLHADSERAFGAQELAREIENTLSLAAYPAASAQEGCALAQRLAGEQGVVCALGSLYLAGEIRAVFHRE